MSLAGRIVFQMDQATFTNQVVLWDFAERREDTGLDSDLHLCAGRHHQEGAEGGPLVARNPANPEHLSFRESPYKQGTFARKPHGQRRVTP